MPAVTAHVSIRMSPAARCPGRNSMLKVRFSPFLECHVCVPCPRPAVCSSAAATDKLSEAPDAIRRYLLVDSAESSHIIGARLWLGVIFVVYLRAKLSLRWRKSKIEIEKIPKYALSA